MKRTLLFAAVFAAVSYAPGALADETPGHAYLSIDGAYAFGEEG